MHNGVLSVFGPVMDLKPWQFALALWLAIFVVEILMTALDGGKQIVIAGWCAFRIGDGIAIPMWAYAEAKLLPLLSATGQWWQNPWIQWAFLGGSAAVSLFIWFAGPLTAKGPDRAKAWHEAWLPSKIYFQIMSMLVTYLIAAPGVAVLSEAIRRHSHGNLPAWTFSWVVLLVLAVILFFGANAVDWKRNVLPGTVPKSHLLYQWGLVMMGLLALRYLPDLFALATGGTFTAFP